MLRVALVTPSGLVTAEAERRLAVDGPNELTARARRGPLRFVLEVVREPMFLLLFAAAGLYLLLGDLGGAATLLGSVVLIVAITAVQEGRTERALEALRDLSSPRARVLRDGVVVTLPARELVVGDVLHVAEGDRVPADAVLRDGTALMVDESLLTGESVPAAKVPTREGTVLGPPGEEAGGALFAGTLVVSGRGVAEVVATGPRAQLGRIGESLREVEREPTPLQREVARLVRTMAIVGLSLSVLVVIVLIASGVAWIQSVLGGITVAMALLPEEFPVVLTVFLAIGAWRISRRRVLTRRMAAVETLGAVHILCTDKTGTLTENRMTVRSLVTAASVVEVSAERALPEDVHAVLEHAILACPDNPFDPMERAFLALGATARLDRAHLHPGWQLEREYPLSPSLLAVTYVWRTGAGEPRVVATKGAPEAIFELCRLDEAAGAAWRARVQQMGKEGLRVLGVARTRSLGAAPDDLRDLTFELVGLVGLEDPLRADVPDALAECVRAGIRVVLITGDHPDTARAIARSAGIPHDEVLTGAEIERLDDAALAAKLETTSIVARAIPAHKLRIVRALRVHGDVIAMTGDGVNDAPALQAADIGIAMGTRGTDVAREAAGLVLVQDDFASIVAAVRIGRRIFDNLRSAFGYIVAVHVPIAGLALGPALLGWGALLTPAHVIFLELIIDPACSVVFELEPEADDLMRRPPRPPRSSLLDLGRVTMSVLQGALVVAASLAVLAWARARGLDVAAQRTLAFALLVGGNLAILVASRSTHQPWWRTLAHKNPAVPILLAAATAIFALTALVPPVAHLFGFGLVHPRALFGAVAIAALPVLLLDALKLLDRPPPARQRE